MTYRFHLSFLNLWNENLAQLGFFREKKIVYLLFSVFCMSNVCQWNKMCRKIAILSEYNMCTLKLEFHSVNCGILFWNCWAMKWAQPGDIWTGSLHLAVYSPALCFQIVDPTFIDTRWGRKVIRIIFYKHKELKL